MYICISIECVCVYKMYMYYTYLYIHAIHTPESVSILYTSMSNDTLKFPFKIYYIYSSTFYFIFHLSFGTFLKLKSTEKAKGL